MTTLAGILLMLFGLGLLGWATVRLWRGMVRYRPPTAADRSQSRNARGAVLYNDQRPRVQRVRFVRRPPQPDDHNDSRE